jgi:hypothetical protein
MKRIDLTNQRFGRLTVIAQDKTDPHHHTKWVCKCDCGRESKVFRNALVSGMSKSCGCLRSEKTRERAQLRREQREMNANEISKS